MHPTTLLKQAAPWLIWGIVLTSIEVAGTRSKHIGIGVSNPRSLSGETVVTAGATQQASTDCRGVGINNGVDHAQQ